MASPTNLSLVLWCRVTNSNANCSATKMFWFVVTPLFVVIMHPLAAKMPVIQFATKEVKQGFAEYNDAGKTVVGNTFGSYRKSL